MSRSGSHLGAALVQECNWGGIPESASRWRQSSTALQVELALWERGIITYYCFSLPHSILKFRFQRCWEVVWTFAIFLLPLHFRLGGRCGEDVDAAFSWGLGP